MVGDSDSDKVLHFKRRVTETDGNQDMTAQLETSNAFSSQQNLDEIVSVSKDLTEMSDTVTPLRFVSDSVKWSSEIDSKAKKDLYGYVNGGETGGIADKDLDFENKEEMKGLVKDAIGVSDTQEVSGNKPVLDVQMDTAVQEPTQGISFEDSPFAGEKQGLTVKEMDSQGSLSKSEEIQFLEGPEVKIQLLNSTDSVSEILGDTNKGIDGSIMAAYNGESVEVFKGRDGSVKCSLKIEVIDDTALIETFPVAKSENGCRKEKGHVGFSKNDRKNVKQELDGKNEKRTRRRGKCVEKGTEKNGNPNSLIDASKDCEKIGPGSKRLYSRKEMESLRYVNIKEQKKKWYEVYCGLGPIVAKEYDDLPKNVHVNFDPRQRRGKDYEPSALPDTGCDDGGDVQDAYIGTAEEYEESDGDGYYDSIHRPAFYVEGEPDFDSGPPEDGLEYLRRVRWETARIPKVKVVRMDKSKLNKQQSIYMPSIPDIAKCPQHLLPSKHWEDAFLANFQELRLNMSHLDESNPVNESLIMEDYPTLSTVRGMDSVARISMLKKRISSTETMATLSRSECAWLFALCVAVDTPLDADMSASLRCLLRKCASLRAGKAELDDEAVMLNILATISGRYFGQAEN